MPERFRYAAVEAALVSIFFIDPSSLGAFRGRITNLRRFSVTPAAPKKGAPVEYAFSDVSILAYCLSLFEYGLDPVSVQVFLAITLDKILPFLLRDCNEDAIFCFHANVMSREFVQNFGEKSIVASTVIPANEATYGEVARILKPQRFDIAQPYTHFLESRICMMNLSHIRRSLIAELRPQDSSTNESLAIRRQIEEAMDVTRRKQSAAT